jgi:transcriptional regulator with PAS, ATPase and Fis domain
MAAPLIRIQPVTVLKPNVNTADKGLSLNGLVLKQKVEEINGGIITESLIRQRSNLRKTAAELGLTRVSLVNEIKRDNLVSEIPVVENHV